MVYHARLIFLVHWCSVIHKETTQMVYDRGYSYTFPTLLLTMIISLKSFETLMPSVMHAITFCTAWRYLRGSFWTSGLRSSTLGRVKTPPGHIDTRYSHPLDTHLPQFSDFASFVLHLLPVSPRTTGKLIMAIQAPPLPQLSQGFASGQLGGPGSTNCSKFQYFHTRIVASSTQDTITLINLPCMALGADCLECQQRSVLGQTLAHTLHLVGLQEYRHQVLVCSLVYGPTRTVV